MKINIFKIKVLMAERRLTNKALVEVAGLSVAGFAAIMKKGEASPINVGKIADALGVPVEEIALPEEG